MNGRLIAIGDVHGCHAELTDLLEQIAPAKDDQLLFLGDLLNRGPDSLKVLELARSLKATTLLGNHELRLLTYRITKDRAVAKEDDLVTYEQLRPEDWAYLEAMPLTHHVPEFETVFVHGGFVPGEPWEQQPAGVVTRIQVIDAEGKPRRRADCPDGRAWADLWTGPPFVVYGHTPRPEIYALKWSVGIDTACVMGGHLTAYLLPEKRFVQVKARKAYFTP
ncbi:MAG TPA: metallophosphoesterase [Opitutaceae bacterium]|nr:metallophosphoesterase [Opitutaceae bacterium]